MTKPLFEVELPPGDSIYVNDVGIQNHTAGYRTLKIYDKEEDEIKEIRVKQSYQDSVNEQNFISYFNCFCHKVHENACEKGWWETERNIGECIALMHSELSEALEAYRNGNPADDKIPAFSGLEAELADCVIRIMDFAAARDLDVGQAIVEKMAFNKTREYRHGNKVA